MEGMFKKKMKYAILGKSGLKVSELCFGVLPMGPLQANIPIKDGAKIIRKGLDSGINFLDTAQVYKTYPYIKDALAGFTGDAVTPVNHVPLVIKR